MGPANLVIGVLLEMTFAAHSSLGGNGEPLRLEDRQRLVDIARELESNPLGPSAQEQRGWALSRIIEAPDLTVSMCLELIGPVLKSKKRHLTEPHFQLAISSAAFILEKPQHASNLHSVSLAGLSGVLRSYERGVQVNPKSRMRFLDNLVKERDAGRLPVVVSDGVARCKQ